MRDEEAARVALAQSFSVATEPPVVEQTATIRTGAFAQADQPVRSEGFESSRGRVAVDGFGDATTAEGPSASGWAGGRLEGRPQAEYREPELLDKPVPVYTAQALQLRVSGKVRLQVEITASGSVRVLKVISPLGHGLDESAIAAATKIRAQPAMRNGRPISVVTTISVVFELA